MNRLVKHVDGVLARVPADSHHGQKIRQELLDHLEERLADRLAGLDSEVDEAIAAFGEPAALERDYYAEYLRARYIGGLIDREPFARRETLLVRAGAGLLGVGLLLGLVVPVVLQFGAFAGVATNLSGAPQPYSPTRVQQLSIPVMAPLGQALMALGICLFYAGGRLSLKRLGLSTVVAHLLPVLGIAFALTARHDVFAAGLGSLMKDVSALAPAADGILPGVLVGFGLVCALILACVGVFAAARRTGQADTIYLRQAAVAVVGLAAGTLMASHPVLYTALRRVSDLSVEPPSPATLVGMLELDFRLFVLGVLLLYASLGRLARILGEVNRTIPARSAVR